MMKKFWLKKFVAIVLMIFVGFDGGCWQAQASFTNSPLTNDVYLEKYEQLIGEPLYKLIRFFIRMFGLERNENGNTHVYVFDENDQAIEFSERLNVLMNNVDVALAENLLNAYRSPIIMREDDLKQQVYEMKDFNEQILGLTEELGDYHYEFKPAEEDYNARRCVEIKFNENYIID